ncbi:MAG: class I SAM-dependent methyltransferase [Micavibrio sp.]|nr:MAG: class I SAM-dependent methyltransferase [Micavibrio sp.]
MSPKFEDIRRHYDRLAASYETRWPSYNTVQIDWMRRRLPQGLSAPAILDLGCGTGAALSDVSTHYPEARLTGVDGSAAMLEKAREKLPDAALLEKNLEDDNAFADLPAADIVFSFSVYHHLQNTDRHLQLLNRLTREGGTVFFSGFAKDGAVMTLADGLFRFRHKGVHQAALPHRDMRQKIENVFRGAEIETAILRPDRFWRIQIFKIIKEGTAHA